MRRPLCAAGVVYLSVLFIMQLIFPIEAPRINIRDNDATPYVLTRSGDETEAIMTGTVTSREYRTYKGVRTPVIYVKTEDIRTVRCLEKSSEDAGGVDCAEGHMISCKLDEKSSPPPVGCRIEIKGKISLYNRATNPGEFDMCRYEQTLGIDVKVRETQVIRRGRSYDKIRESLALCRDRSASILISLFGEQDGGILSSIVLGDKSNLDDELKAMYQRNGIIHILAISGLHISLLGMGLYKLLKKCRLHTVLSAAAAIAVMYLYGVMCGMAASAERAIIMFTFAMTAKMIGRTYDLLTALCTAAIMIVTRQPMYLQYSGFLFSFGAVLAIGAFLPAANEIFPGPDMSRSQITKDQMESRRFRIRLKAKEKIVNLRAVFLSGIVIAVVTLPVHLYCFYEFPTFSLILNILVIPLMTFVMMGTLIGLGLSFVWFPLGKIMVLPVHLILSIYDAGCRAGDALPVNVLVTGQPYLWQISIYCILIVSIFTLRKYIPVIVFSLSILVSVQFVIMNMDFGLKIIIADVGQGDGIFISDNKGFDILIDGGSSTKKNVGKYQLEPLLKSQGAGTLDAVFITHLDSDHYNGILELIEMSDEGGIEIGEIVLNPLVISSGGEKLQELVELTEKHGIPIAKISKGKEICKGKLKLTCLYPENTDSEISSKDMKSSGYAMRVDAVSGDAVSGDAVSGDTVNGDVVSRDAMSGDTVNGDAGNGTDMNAVSTVLYLEYEDFTAIFTGDLEGKGETSLMRILTDRGLSGQAVTVLKVAHHGSKNTTSKVFLDEVRPRVSVLSAGRRNKYGHPHKELLDRLDAAGTRRLCTIDEGAVIVKVKGGKTTVHGFSGYNE